MKKMLTFYEIQLEKTSKDAKKIADDDKALADQKRADEEAAETKLKGAVDNYNKEAEVAENLEKDFEAKLL